MSLATYLLLDAFRGDADVSIVVSDDFVLKESLRITRSELGRRVGVVSPRCKTWLRSAVNAQFYRPVREPTLLACQFPGQLRDANGTISRPATWA